MRSIITFLIRCTKKAHATLYITNKIIDTIILNLSLQGMFWHFKAFCRSTLVSYKIKVFGFNDSTSMMKLPFWKMISHPMPMKQLNMYSAPSTNVNIYSNWFAANVYIFITTVKLHSAHQWKVINMYMYHTCRAIL